MALTTADAIPVEHSRSGTLAAVATLFRPDFENLTLADVQQFLDVAGDESLTWEAKGPDLRPDHVRVAASAFGNSVLGGYLIVGAVRRVKNLPGWDFVGVDPARVNGELGTWVSVSMLPLENRPTFSVAGPWTLPNGNLACVVWIRPSPTPPVLTTHGHIHERLDGTSPHITDRASLARIFERGQRARDGAEAAGKRIAQALMDGLRIEDARGRASYVAVIVPTGGPVDRSALLFTDRFSEQLQDSLHSLGQNNHVMARPQGQMWQDRFEAWVGDNDGFSITAFWNGAIAVGFRLDGGSPGLEYAVSADVVRPTLGAARSLAQDIGGYGPTYVRIGARSARTGNKPVYLGRWIELDAEIADAMLQSISREFDRATGRSTPEPRLPTTEG